jgi:hypothetical protein
MSKALEAADWAAAEPDRIKRRDLEDEAVRWRNLARQVTPRGQQ